MTYKLLEASKALKNAKKVMIVAHVNPDGDTLGCLLALGLSLLQQGKKVYLLFYQEVVFPFLASVGVGTMIWFHVHRVGLYIDSVYFFFGGW